MNYIFAFPLVYSNDSTSGLQPFVERCCHYQLFFDHLKFYFHSSVLGALEINDPMDCFKYQIQVLKIVGAFHEPSWNVFMKSLSRFLIVLQVKLCVMSALYLGSSDVLLEVFCSDDFQNKRITKMVTL